MGNLLGREVLLGASDTEGGLIGVGANDVSEGVVVGLEDGSLDGWEEG